MQHDAPALFAIHGHAESMRFFGTDPLTEVAQAERLIEKFAAWRTMPNPGVRWGITLADTGALIGTCGLFAWNRDWHKCAIGYELAPAARGQGYMREALGAAITWGWSAMDLNRIEAQIHPDNAPSIALAERLGFQREGLLREVAYWGGSFKDLAQYGLLKREFSG